MAKVPWYKNAVFYGLDVRRFQDSNGDGFGDIPGLIDRLDYLSELGVDALWMLPFFDTPFGDNGYDIRDYYRIDPRVGSLEDFSRLVEAARERGIRLVIDLVMNHTSHEHPWFQASRRDAESRYRDYYIWTEKIPKKTIGETIFPGEEDGVWEHDPLAKAHYFHRFYHFQPDLKISNPEVREEIFKVIDFWLSFGVDGFRIDAAPIMIDPKGFKNNVMEDPHQFFRDMHNYVLSRQAETVLLAEANVQLDLMDEFFGGDTEFNMLFNFLIGPHIMLALARENAHPLHVYLQDQIDPPKNDQWLNFIRNLDEFTLEKMPEREKRDIMKVYAPEKDMLIYDRGIRRRLAPMLSDGEPDINQEKIELAYSLLFSFPGTPMFVYGDEIGMGDDLSLPGRNAARTPMQWTAEKNAGFSSAETLVAPVIEEGIFRYKKVNVASQQRDPKSLYHFMKALIAARKSCPEIGLCHEVPIETEEKDEQIVAHHYCPDVGGENSPPLFFHNLSAETRSATIPIDKRYAGKIQRQIGRGEVLSSEDGKLRVKLPPYGYLWLSS